MEIFKVQRVTNHLIKRYLGKQAFPKFILNYENDSMIQNYSIYAMTHSWDQKFQKKVKMIEFVKAHFQMSNLIAPCVPLVDFYCKRMASSEFAKDCLRICILQSHFVRVEIGSP